MTDTTTCIFSGDGSGAQARLDHVRKPPMATDLVYGVTPNPMPACMRCARAWAKDGYKVQDIRSAVSVNS